MDNPEKLGTQDTEQRQRTQKTQHKIPKPKKINNTDPIKNWW
jgi:hypothetical protein